MADVNAPVPVPKFTSEANWTVLVEVPVPAFQIMVPVMDPELENVCVPVDLLKLIVAVPAPLFCKSAVFADCVMAMFPATLRVPIPAEVTSRREFVEPLLVTFKLPPIPKIYVPLEERRNTAVPVPVASTEKFPLMVGGVIAFN